MCESHPDGYGVVGVGCRPATTAAEILSAVREVLGDNKIRCIATIDRRASEPGMCTAAAELDVPVVTFTAAELAEVRVPNPVDRTLAALATPSVAEAAALLACEKCCGTSYLVISKTVRGPVTVAMAESR
ncbi:cobalamin biosynthesis protein [Nocardia macrotermitis]|uniref:cobalamin biosynthesis protein n=1 Tax=Nocardia macrotermitis TaxID=2585198 RepID=UPI0012977E1A|nr:cobalamin biosynthesis protein [Nocardia macrotermitis]